MCEHAVSWIYKLPSNFVWESPWRLTEDVICRDKTGTVRLIVEAEGRVTVTSDYAWNGCSPKFCVFDLLFGTPDGVVDSRTEHPKTYYASLVHDALYQFFPDGLPLGRAEADRSFYLLMAATGFRLRFLYWLAVRLAGGAIWRAQRRARHNAGRIDTAQAWGGAGRGHE